MTRVAEYRFRFSWLANLGAILLALLFLTNWPTYHHIILGGPVPLIYYLIFSVLVIPLLAIRSRALRFVLREPLVTWFVIYTVSGLLWLLLAGEFVDEESRQWRLRFLALCVFLISLAFTSGANSRTVSTIILTCMVIASVNNWLDFLFPFSFVPQGSEYSNPGRGAGLFVNANQAGMAVIAMGIAALPFAKMRFRALILVTVLVGVLPTFSRSAIAFAVIVSALAIVLGQVNRRQLLLMAALIPPLVVIVWQGHEYGASSGDVNLKNIEERLEFFASVGEALDDSASERRQVAAIAWRMFGDSPLLGNGIASTAAAYYGRGTHNMYLMLLAEQGVLGGVLYLSFVLILLSKGSRLLRTAESQEHKDVGSALLLMSAYFAVFGLFSHNVLEDPSTFFLLAFLCSTGWIAIEDTHSREAARTSYRHAL